MEKEIERILASRPVKRIADENLVPSAVLLLLFRKDGQEHILLTKRSDQVEFHKGEISFPGGKRDPSDSNLLQTALREGAEEIGLAPRDVTILGRMDDISTATTGFVVAPYVGVIPYPYPFQLNADEIADLIFVPLRILADEWSVAAPEVSPGGKGIAAGPFHYGDHVIWGATARILKQFLDVTMPTTGHRGMGARGNASRGSIDRRA